MHGRFNQTGIFHENENMGLNDYNDLNYSLLESTNDLSLLSSSNKAFNFDNADNKFQQPAPIRRRQVYSRRITKTTDFDFDEEVYAHSDWFDRFSRRMIDTAKTLSPFNEEEPLESQLYSNQSYIKHPRPTECSRAAFWKGRTLPKSNKTLKDIILRISQINFWWLLLRNLWRSKTKKFYTTLFFLSLYLFPMIYLFISLWSYIPTIEKEWNSLFQHNPTNTTITSATTDLTTIQSFLEQLEYKQETFKHQVEIELQNFSSLFKNLLTNSTEDYVDISESISLLETKINILENSLHSISYNSNYNNSIASDKTFEDLVSHLTSSYSKDLSYEIENLKTLFKDLLKSEHSTISTKIRNEIVEYLDTRLSNPSSTDKDLNEYKPPPNKNSDSSKLGYSNSTIQDIDHKRMIIIEERISQLYNQHFMDSTGRVDWALQSLGAKIIHSETSPALNTDDWFESILNFIGSKLPSEVVNDMIKPMGKPPEVVLQPDVNPGQCFAFSGSQGSIAIRLPATINVTSITLEHVHKNINNNIGSTPKYFKVYGTPDPRWPDAFESTTEHDDNESKQTCSYGNSGCIIHPTNWLDWDMFWKRMKGIWNKQNQIQEIGNFYFDHQRRIQSYPINSDFPMNRITFKFVNNYGGTYTCIYRIRVHGNKIQRKLMS